MPTLDMKAMADGVITAVKAYVTKAEAVLARRIDAIEASLSDLRGLVAPPPDIEEIIRSAVEMVKADIPPPKDGASVTVEDVAPLIGAEVEKAIASMPAPKDGSSVLVADVAPLITSEVAKAVAALPAAKDGESIPIERVQAMVDEAVSKAASAVRVPKDGDPGRDAAHLEILPGIDVERSYVRGTYAKHAGGLWRSFETTTAMKGWECIVEGVAQLSVDQDAENPRKFAVTIARSSGAEQVKEFNLPVVLYRGIYREGDDYEAGDSVTWGGSTWIALQDTKSKPDSIDGTWRLAVKKGSPGKDAK